MDTLKLAELQAAAGDLFTAEELELIARPAPAPEPEPTRQEQAPPSIQARFVMAFDHDAIMADLDAMVAPTTAALERLQEIAERQGRFHAAERERAATAWTPATRTDRRGVMWDCLPPDTPPRSCDEIEDDGVWRPRPSISQTASRYDRAVFARIEAQRHLDHITGQCAAESLPVRAARMKLDMALQAQRKALAASDDPTVKGRDRIDLWRKDHAPDYNTSRRTVRTVANADLSGLTAEEKAQRKREMDRERAAQKRAAQKAEGTTS